MADKYHGRLIGIVVDNLRRLGATYYTTTEAIQGGGYIHTHEGNLGWYPFKIIEPLGIKRRKSWWEL